MESVNQLKEGVQLQPKKEKRKLEPMLLVLQYTHGCTDNDHWMLLRG